MLVLTRKPNQSVILEVNGIEIVVTVVNLKNGQTRLGFTAPPEVKIRREELEPLAQSPLG